MDTQIDPEDRGESVRYSSAFRCLPGVQPKPLHLNDGCRWPIHAKIRIDVALEPSTVLQCGQPRVYIRDRALPYCEDHCLIAYRPSDGR